MFQNHVSEPYFITMFQNHISWFRAHVRIAPVGGRLTRLALRRSLGASTCAAKVFPTQRPFARLPCSPHPPPKGWCTHLPKWQSSSLRSAAFVALRGPPRPPPSNVRVGLGSPLAAKALEWAGEHPGGLFPQRVPDAATVRHNDTAAPLQPVSKTVPFLAA